MSDQITVFPAPQPVVSEAAEKQHSAQPSTHVPEYLWYKNRLQEYAQKSSLALPVYHTVNEGFQHATGFRSTVLVDGTYYTSPNIFSNRKSAEQDVAKIALNAITQKIKDEGCPFVHEDTIFCKSILNEYATKMHLEKPTYEIAQPQGLIPIFVCSLVFNGVTYTGKVGRNKKEAEQLAARSVILSILGNSDSGSIVMSEIVKSKNRLYAAIYDVKDLTNNHNGVMSVATSGTSLGPPLNKGKEIEDTGAIHAMSSTAIIENHSGQVPSMPVVDQPFHEFKKPKLDSVAVPFTPPIVFVPPVNEQPSGVGPSSAKKRRKKKPKKNHQAIAQLLYPVGPMTQIPCSIPQ